MVAAPSRGYRRNTKPSRNPIVRSAVVFKQTFLKYTNLHSKSGRDGRRKQRLTGAAARREKSKWPRSREIQRGLGGSFRPYHVTTPALKEKNPLSALRHTLLKKIKGTL